MTLQLGHRKTEGRDEGFWCGRSRRVDVAAEPSIDIAAAMLGDLTSGRHFEFVMWTCAQRSRILSEVPHNQVERVVFCCRD